MRFSLATLLTVASASLSVASPTRDHTSPRPTVSCLPIHPRVPPPSPPARNRVCYVRSHNDGVTDDSAYILDAFHDCNNGGHVVFREGVEYFIATAMDWTFLNHIDIGIVSENCLLAPSLIL